MIRKTLLASAVAFGFAGSAFAASDIVDTAAGNSDFETLVAAVQAAGLVDTLKGEGPFTVFAPTNEAFAELGATVDELLLPENQEKLQAVLTYHVIPGKVMSSDLQDDMAAATVQGQEVTINLDNGPMVGEANIVTPDIEATNGVIHVIDQVLVPEGVL